LINDLDRIRDLGVDYVYLLPIHEIGVERKKGTLGCPYSIKDFYSVAKELGTLEELHLLRDEIHTRGMKLMIDIVFNHTSHDSVLLKDHPEWFFYRNGELAGKVGDWYDITDLDYNNKELWDYMIDVIKYWSNQGIDGFRCDVASMVPMDFWVKARKEVEKINPDTIWLSESVHGSFNKYIRDNGHYCASESEVYGVFDMAYDYDIHQLYEGYLLGNVRLNSYLQATEQQEYIYPENYVKMRNTDNHDFPRIASYVKESHQIRNWHALMFFLRGATMVYGGSEFSDPKLPSLFDKDVMTRDGEDISELLKKLAEITNSRICGEGVYTIHYNDMDVAHLQYELDGSVLTGIFNFGNKDVTLGTGVYKNLLTNDLIDVSLIKRDCGPIIIEGVIQGGKTT
jgi:glycosidase